MDDSLQALAGWLEQIADPFRELRDGVQQVIKIAGDSPEMALTRSRKVLECYNSSQIASASGAAYTPLIPDYS